MQIGKSPVLLNSRWISLSGMMAMTIAARVRLVLVMLPHSRRASHNRRLAAAVIGLIILKANVERHCRTSGRDGQKRNTNKLEARYFVEQAGGQAHQKSAKQIFSGKMPQHFGRKLFTNVHNYGVVFYRNSRHSERREIFGR